MNVGLAKGGRSRLALGRSDLMRGRSRLISAILSGEVPRVEWSGEEFQIVGAGTTG
jgi:hypothetical protein